MTSFESRILGWICLVLGGAFAYLDSQWLALLFLLGAFVFIIYTVAKDFDVGGGPLSPA